MNDLFDSIEKKMWFEKMKGKSILSFPFIPDRIKNAVPIFDPTEEAAAPIMDWVLSKSIFKKYNDPNSEEQIQNCKKELFVKNYNRLASVEEIQEVIADIINYAKNKGNMLPKTRILKNEVVNYLNEYNALLNQHKDTNNEFSEQMKTEQDFITKIKQIIINT